MQSGNDKTDHPRVRGGAYDLIFEEDTVLELHVRRVPGGLASDHWLFGTVAVGDRVDAIGPLGDFHVPTTEEDAGEPMMLIGGGTGLAPLVGIVRTALARHPERAVVLYHGVRDESDLYDRERFAELEASYAGFRFVPVLSDFASNRLPDGLPHRLVPRRRAERSGMVRLALRSPADGRSRRRGFQAPAHGTTPHRPREVHAGRRARHRLNV